MNWWSIISENEHAFPARCQVLFIAPLPSVLPMLFSALNWQLAISCASGINVDPSVLSGSNEAETPNEASVQLLKIWDKYIYISIRKQTRFLGTRSAMITLCLRKEKNTFAPQHSTSIDPNPSHLMGEDSPPHQAKWFFFTPRDSVRMEPNISKGFWGDEDSLLSRGRLEGGYLEWIHLSE